MSDVDPKAASETASNAALNAASNAASIGNAGAGNVNFGAGDVEGPGEMDGDFFEDFRTALNATMKITKTARTTPITPIKRNRLPGTEVLSDPKRKKKWYSKTGKNGAGKKTESAENAAATTPDGDAADNAATPSGEDETEASRRHVSTHPVRLVVTEKGFRTVSDTFVKSLGTKLEGFDLPDFVYGGYDGPRPSSSRGSNDSRDFLLGPNQTVDRTDGAASSNAASGAKNNAPAGNDVAGNDGAAAGARQDTGAVAASLRTMKDATLVTGWRRGPLTALCRRSSASMRKVRARIDRFNIYTGVSENELVLRFKGDVVVVGDYEYKIGCRRWSDFGKAHVYVKNLKVTLKLELVAPKEAPPRFKLVVHDSSVTRDPRVEVTRINVKCDSGTGGSVGCFTRFVGREGMSRVLRRWLIKKSPRFIADFLNSSPLLTFDRNFYHYCDGGLDLDLGLGRRGTLLLGDYADHDEDTISAKFGNCVHYWTGESVGLDISMTVKREIVVDVEPTPPTTLTATMAATTSGGAAAADKNDAVADGKDAGDAGNVSGNAGKDSGADADAASGDGAASSLPSATDFEDRVTRLFPRKVGAKYDFFLLFPEEAVQAMTCEGIKEALVPLMQVMETHAAELAAPFRDAGGTKIRARASFRGDPRVLIKADAYGFVIEGTIVVQMGANIDAERRALRKIAKYMKKSKQDKNKTEKRKPGPRSGFFGDHAIYAQHPANQAFNVNQTGNDDKFDADDIDGDAKEGGVDGVDADGVPASNGVGDGSGPPGSGSGQKEFSATIVFPFRMTSGIVSRPQEIYWGWARMTPCILRDRDLKADKRKENERQQAQETEWKIVRKIEDEFEGGVDVSAQWMGIRSGTDKQWVDANADKWYLKPDRFRGKTSVEEINIPNLPLDYPDASALATNLAIQADKVIAEHWKKHMRMSNGLVCVGSPLIGNPVLGCCGRVKPYFWLEQGLLAVVFNAEMTSDFAECVLEALKGNTFVGAQRYEYQPQRL